MARESFFIAAWRFNRKWPLWLGAFLLIDLILFGWIHYGVVPEVNSLERQYLKRQTETRKVLRQGDKERTSRQSLHQGPEDLATFREALPPKGQFTSLIAELFEMSRKTNLDIAQVSYQPEELTEQQLLRYSLSFSIGGEYHQLKRFISLLEQSSRIIAIDGITLSGGGSKDDQVTLQLRLSTYFRAEES